MLQECDCCHGEFAVLDIVFDGKFFYCFDCVSDSGGENLTSVETTFYTQEEAS